MATGKLAEAIVDAAKKKVSGDYGSLLSVEDYGRAVEKEMAIYEEEFNAHGTIDGKDCLPLKEHKYFTNSCPFCGSSRVHIVSIGFLFGVECLNCHAKYENLSSAEEAARRWNKRGYHGEKARLAIFNAVRIADRIDEHLGDAKNALQDITEMLEAARASAKNAEAAISQCDEDD